jgi:two-component system chemotaxis response regulator CheB
VVGFMPQHAADIAGADHIVPASELAARLIQLVGAPVPETPGADALDPIAEMPEVVKQDMVEQALNERRGELSTFTCPECGGALWQIDQDLPHFRCHVGHAYNGDTLLADQSEVLEAALWSAVRGFREKAVLCRQLEAAALDRGNDSVAQRFRDQATQAAEYSDLIVKHVLHAEAKPATWSPRFPLQDQQGA